MSVPTQDQVLEDMVCRSWIRTVVPKLRDAEELQGGAESLH